MTGTAAAARRSGGATLPSVTLAELQRPIAGALAAVRAAMTDIVTGDAPLLSAAAGHLLGTSGKMFRPTLVILASRIDDDPDDERAVLLAATVELVHLATLVHDDAVDHSVLRRGMPTLNSLYGHQVSVIMGDFLYLSALAQLASTGDLDALRPLVHASTRMTVGELRQLSDSDPLGFTEAGYEQLIRAKTASFMAAACHVGALCGATRHVPQLVEFGEALGMAFQIIDDVIDYTEASATTGKPSGLDIREKKVTLPLIAALAAAGPGARAEIARVFAADTPSQEQVDSVVAIVRESGGLDYARRQGASWAGRAEAALATLPPTRAREVLGSAILYVMERHA